MTTAHDPPPEADAPSNLALRLRPRLSKACYIRKADPNVDYWFDFSAKKLEEYRNARGDDFLLVIAGAAGLERDYYAMPFARVSNAFTAA